MRKNVFFTFWFSLIPGVGQMYQEYLKRGVSLLIFAIAPVALATIFNAPIFTLVLPIVFAYSFFDSFRLRNNFISTGERVPDDYIWNEDFFKEIASKKMFNQKNVILGVILLAIGIYYLLNTVVLGIFEEAGIEMRIIYTIRGFLRYIPTLILATTAIMIGGKLITNKEKE